MLSQKHFQESNIDMIEHKDIETGKDKKVIQISD